MSERLSVTYLWVASKLLPIIGSCSGLVMLQLPHVSIPQNDPPGIRRQPVHDRIAGNTLGQGLHPIRRISLTRDNRRQPILTFSQNREQVTGNILIDAHREEVVDNQQVNIAKLQQQILMSHPVVSRDEQLPGQVVHPRVSHGMLRVAGGNTDRANKVRLARPVAEMTIRFVVSARH